MTDEIKNDLEILKMRSVLDPKHFYKKNDLSVLPKYFQVVMTLNVIILYCFLRYIFCFRLEKLWIHH